MNTSNCWGCGNPIPRLRIKDGKYSFYCSECTCATKWKDGLLEAESDWNNGYVCEEDIGKFWELMMKIELVESGLDDVLETIRDTLKKALGANTERDKDAQIYKALGAVDAVYKMVNVRYEYDSEEVVE